MARTQKRKTKPQQTSPPATATATADWCSRSDAASTDRLSARGGGRVDAGEVAVVRRSSIAPLLVCGLCGGMLREATTVSECLHSFCRICISEKFKDEDNKCCPTCNIDLGCEPKLRVDHSQQLRSAMFPDVGLVAEPMDGETETKANERLGMQFFASPEVLGQSQLTTASPVLDQISMEIQANSSSSHILASVQYNDNLRNQVFSMCNEKELCSMLIPRQSKVRELENAISVSFERAKVLEKRLKEQAERHQIQSKLLQETEAAQREALRENRALKQEIADKTEELSNLKNNFTMIEKRCTQVEQRNTVLEDQIEHVNRLLEAEKSNTRKLNEQLCKAVNEKNKLMTELETYNDGLAKIQGCIHKSLTARISRLKGVAATTKLGHYQHLLARMDALEQVKEHLPKMLETIEVATSLSAYSLAAAVLIRLRAYHGDGFDLERLVMPLHLNRQDYARIRNAVDPLAAKVAQKDFVNIDVQKISHGLQACLVGTYALSFVTTLLGI